MAATVISSSNHSGIWILPSNDETHERHFKRGSAEAGDPGSNAHLGNLMLEFGGNGHADAGDCQVPNDKADQVLQALVQRITVAG